MVNYFRWVVAGLVAGVVSLPVVALVQSDDEGRRGPGRDWTFFGGDWTNQRHSTLTQVTTQNVKTLRGAWTMKFDGNASTRATPIVKDGVMFVSAGSRLYALDAKTGERKWVWRPAEEAPERLEAANIGDLLNSGFGIPNPPGVSLGDGMVFVGLMDGRVAAIKQSTGVWAVAASVVWIAEPRVDVGRQVGGEFDVFQVIDQLAFERSEGRRQRGPELAEDAAAIGAGGVDDGEHGTLVGEAGEWFEDVVARRGLEEFVAIERVLRADEHLAAVAAGFEELGELDDRQIPSSRGVLEASRGRTLRRLQDVCWAPWWR